MTRQARGRAVWVRDGDTALVALLDFSREGVLSLDRHILVDYDCPNSWGECVFLDGGNCAISYAAGEESADAAYRRGGVEDLHVELERLLDS